MEKQRQDHNDIIRKRTDSEQTASRGRGGQQNIIIKTLSRRSFKNNRRRNLVAILAIVLTTMMFTTLFTLAQSLGRNMTEMYLRQSGTTAHTSTKSITDEEIEKSPPILCGTFRLFHCPGQRPEHFPGRTAGGDPLRERPIRQR